MRSSGGKSEDANATNHVGGTLYDVLGVNAGVSFEQLRSAFKRRALESHPDKLGGSKEAFQRVLAAFELLTDQGKRAKYDQRLSRKDVESVKTGRNEQHSTGCAMPSERKDSKNRIHPEIRRSAEKPDAKGAQHLTSDRRKPTPDTAEEASRRPTTPCGRARKEQHLLYSLWKELREASLEQRRSLIDRVLPERLRQALETWILANQASGSKAQESSAVSMPNDDADDDADDDDDVSTDDASGSSNESFELNKVTDDSADHSGALAICNTSDVSDVEEEEFAGVDVGGVAGFGQGGRGRCRTRGLSSSRKGSLMYYWGSQSYGALRMTSRWTVDLGTALDHLLVLVSAKRFAMQFVSDGRGQPEEGIERGMSEALMDANTTADEVGIRYFVCLHKSFFIGRRTQLTTPSQHCLKTVLQQWRLFVDLQEELSFHGQVTRNMLSKFTLTELEDNWSRFCTAYVSVCEAGGQSAEEVKSRLVALEKAHMPARERQMEAWYAARMLREERGQHRLAHAEERALMRERSHMQREDRRCHAVQKRSAAAAERIARAVRLLVDRWNRRETRRRARAVTLERRRALQAQRRDLRQQVALRKARWRQMNRRDITMADLLGSRPAG